MPGEAGASASYVYVSLCLSYRAQPYIAKCEKECRTFGPAGAPICRSKRKSAGLGVFFIHCTEKLCIFSAGHLDRQVFRTCRSKRKSASQDRRTGTFRDVCMAIIILIIHLLTQTFLSPHFTAFLGTLSKDFSRSRKVRCSV